MGCKNVTPKKKIYCIGMFEQFIDVQQRDISPNDDGPDTEQSFVTVNSYPAIVETTDNGTIIVNGIGIEERITHRFTIQFDPTNQFGTKTNVINFNNSIFEIARIENVDERNEFIIFHSKQRLEKF